MPPATAASNSRSTPASSAAANSSVPTLASSSLLAVTTGLPCLSAVVISSRAGSMPPITSTTRSIVGLLTTAYVSRVSTPSGRATSRGRRGCARRPRRSPGGRRCGPRSPPAGGRRARRTRRRRCRSRGRRCGRCDALLAQSRRRGYGSGPSAGTDIPASAQRAAVGSPCAGDHGVEVGPVEDRALTAHLAGRDVQQTLDLGVARPPLAVPPAGARRGPAPRCGAPWTSAARPPAARPRRPMTTTGRSLPCDGSSS